MDRRVALLAGTTLSDPTYARVLPELARALTPLSWRARAFCPRRDGRRLTAFRPAVVNLHCSGHAEPAAVEAVRAQQRRGARLVLTFQDLDHPELARACRDGAAALSRLVRDADELTALTPELARAVSRRFGGRRTRVIANGVGESWFLPARARRGPVVAVARLSPYKGVDVLLWAFSELAREDASARLEVLGPDFHAGHFQRLAERLGLSGRVRFRGRAGAARLQRALGSARLVVSASRRETYGLAILEAMAAGAPLLATRTGAAPLLLRHGRSAWLVEPGDPAALAAGLRALWAREPLRRRLGEAARRRARAHTWARRAALYDAAFREALRAA